ncbi:MAG: DUF421 domain-containing protein [Rhodomicrobium sp.]|nr:MAG: DUF421 domain-containing protein [Rhodomicrobium sp.]
MLEWLTISFTEIFGIIITTIGIYVALIILVRINGLRSFSKISGHDFAVTVAIGSVFATSIISPSPSLLQGAVAIGALLIWRALLSYLRLFGLSSLLDNQPLLIMKDGHVLEDNLYKANFTKEDLYAKLREANALSLGQVKAVVVESTGDVSVLHGEDKQYDESILLGVKS